MRSRHAHRTVVKLYTEDLATKVDLCRVAIYIIGANAAISSILIGYAAEGTAHHGPHAEPLYETSALVEFEGEVTEVVWRNPHARFRIRVTSGPETGEIADYGCTLWE